MEREDRCIGFGLRRQPFKIVAPASRVPSVIDKGFELVALERLGVAGIGILDDAPLITASVCGFHR